MHYSKPILERSLKWKKNINSFQQYFLSYRNQADSYKYIKIEIKRCTFKNVCVWLKLAVASPIS